MDSVAAQEYTNREYVAVDGASTDGTVDVLQRRSAEVARWTSESDPRGIYAAMNKGVQLASGRYVCFMNAGDRFASPHALAGLLVPAPSAQLIWGDCIVEKGRREKYRSARDTLRKLSVAMVVSHQSLLATRELLVHHPFNSELRIAADYEFFVDSILAGATCEYRALPVSRVDYAGQSTLAFRVGIQEKRSVSISRFPKRRFASSLYFFILELYMSIKIALGTFHVS
jgi:glycosyltransferase involved in cell wall biosynthesis